MLPIFCTFPRSRGYWFGSDNTGECELFFASHFFAIHLYCVFTLKLSFEKFLAYRVFDKVFKRSTKWTRTKIGIRALLDKEFFSIVSQFEL